MRHLMAALSDKGRWRISGVGPGYVVVAARARALAEDKGAQLLMHEAQPDQAVTVTEVRRVGWLFYVRSDLTPYPSAVRPWQADARRDKARAPRTPPAASREPFEGRAYIGRVLVWFSESGYGSIACADRSLGNVAIRRSDLSKGEESALQAGQYVSFMIKKTPDGVFAINVFTYG